MACSGGKGGRREVEVLGKELEEGTGEAECCSVAEKVVSTLQMCNEITVKHMILLHVSVMISHANMYGTHVLL